MVVKGSNFKCDPLKGSDFKSDPLEKVSMSMTCGARKCAVCLTDGTATRRSAHPIAVEWVGSNTQLGDINV